MEYYSALKISEIIKQRKVFKCILLSKISLWKGYTIPNRWHSVNVKIVETVKRLVAVRAGMWKGMNKKTQDMQIINVLYIIMVDTYQYIFGPNSTSDCQTSNMNRNEYKTKGDFQIINVVYYNCQYLALYIIIYLYKLKHFTIPYSEMM